MQAIIQILNLIGGLGIFLIGMRWMSDGIQRRAGNRFRSFLHTMTNNRFAGVATGLGVTGVIQSSSATTVLLVSLVNAGLVTLRQSIGVIMGANIGTTLTAWIVSLIGFKLSITDFALPAIAVALPLYFGKSQRLREVAGILIGFGLLFLGLHLMKESVPDIGSNPDALAFLRNWSELGFWSIPIFIVAGAILTIIVQSSSAAMTITITMAFRGWITFPVAAAIVLGENIGTTITAFLAALPMGSSARRAARAHMLFNVFGVLWMLAVFYPFTSLIDRLMPGLASDPAAIPLHLSLFHTVFNVANTALLIAFVPQIERVVSWLVPDRVRVVSAGTYRLALVSPNLPDALDSNLVTIRGELAAMSRRAVEMLQGVMDASREPARLEAVRKQLESTEQYVDDMQESITEFLTNSMRWHVSDAQARAIQAAQRIAHELESISDACFSIGLLLDRMHRKGRRFHEDGDRELFDYTTQVLEFINYNGAILARATSGPDLERARAMEDGIDKVRNRLRKRSRKSIERETDIDVRGELIFIDIVRHLEHIGDNSLNISEAVGELA
ncbi:MAG: Na/Pi cotransporter family protein [Spirochaetota bacterium]